MVDCLSLLLIILVPLCYGSRFLDEKISDSRNLAIWDELFEYNIISLQDRDWIIANMINAEIYEFRSSFYVKWNDPDERKMFELWKC
jgi:hypothetical protein